MSYAHFLLKYDTIEYYECTTRQVTIHVSEQQQIENILNNDGLLFWNDFQLKMLNDEFQTIRGAKLMPHTSGSWLHDPEHPFAPNNEPEIHASFQSWRNRYVIGELNGNQIHTSLCMFIFPFTLVEDQLNPQWVYTTSKNVYRLM